MKKAKKLRVASWIVGVIGLLLCAILAGSALIMIHGLSLFNIELDKVESISFTNPGSGDVIFTYVPAMLHVWIIAGVAALILIIAIILRAASVAVAKKATAAVAAAKPANKVQALVATAKGKVSKVGEKVGSKIKVNDATKAKVTGFVKKNAPVLIAVATTFAVTTTIDRIVMAKKIRKIRRR